MDDEGYLVLGQFSEDNFTLQGVGTGHIVTVAAEVAQRHRGVQDPRYANWIIPYWRGLALFENLDRLRTRGQI
ncbi:hypothetical protein [Burkholderia sp. ABCPW 14]|uniref:hypothetical protein n=1 Tax=Burkholderia sp. ABCPW 14 TaxID=1637860 RepID=UPI000B2D6C9A|nr:hypothetical protein [Burkholderia sp. ABCPW 14]